jgi:hypothetical protein
MAAPSRVRTFLLAVFMMALLGGLCLFMKHFGLFGPMNEYAYFGALTVLIALYGCSAAASAYYGFRGGPEAAKYSTEEELDQEGRTRATLAFEKGALRALLAIGLPGFLAWLLVYFVVV